MGIYFDKTHQKYKVGYRYHNKIYYGGYYTSLEDATTAEKKLKDRNYQNKKQTQNKTYETPGIIFDKCINKWVVCVLKNYVGSYNTLKKAQREYDKYYNNLIDGKVV